MPSDLELALASLSKAIDNVDLKQDGVIAALQISLNEGINSIKTDLEARIAAATNYSAQLKVQVDTLAARVAVLEKVPTPVPTPTPTPTPTPPPVVVKPVFSGIADAMPTEVSGGATARVTATFKSDRDVNDILVAIDVYDSAQKRVHQSSQAGVAFKTGVPYVYTVTVPFPNVIGNYTVKLGVFNFDWKINYYWNGNAAVVKVSAASGGTTPPPPPGPVIIIPGDTIDANIQPLAGKNYPRPVPISMIGVYPEIRPENTPANQRRPDGLIEPWPAEPADKNSAAWWEWNYHHVGWGLIYKKVTGDAAGRNLTTEQILEWAALKWRFDEVTFEGLSGIDAFKAMAVNESWWRQSAEGDKNATTGLFDSFGLVQMRRPFWLSAYNSRLCSALNVDIGAALLRCRYDGMHKWMGNDGDGTRGNLLWSIAAHFSGRPYAQRGGAPASSRPMLGHPDLEPYATNWFKHFKDKPWKNSLGKAPYWF